MQDFVKYSYTAAIIALELIALVLIFRNQHFAKVVLRFSIPITTVYFFISFLPILISLITCAQKQSPLLAIPNAILSPALFIIFLIAGYFLSRKNKLSPFPALRNLRFSASKHKHRQPVFYWRPALIISTSIILYSLALNLLFRPQPLLKPFEVFPDFLFCSDFSAIQFALFLTATAIYEEIFYRLFLQNFLERLLRKLNFGTLLAIIITSSFWAIGHYGMLDPGGTKELQIFGVGLALSYAARKYGIEVCILGHTLLNLFALLNVTTG